jgi:hypothetical protein
MPDGTIIKTGLLTATILAAMPGEQLFLSTPDFCKALSQRIAKAEGHPVELLKEK